MIEAESAIEASRAAVKRLQVEIADATLKAPRAGRIQHRVAQPGEVLGSGGKLLTLIDLSDVYMNFFLPESTAGKLALAAFLPVFTVASVLLPLQILSGASTPRESMPLIVQNIMQLAPTTHFVSFAQAILYRGAGLEIVWPQFLATAVIGAFFFGGALVRFRKAITTQLS